ncbi:unnamed protein product, partial [Adineta ricciae]
MTRTRQARGVQHATVTNSISASTYDGLDEDIDGNGIENDQTMDEGQVEHDVSMTEEEEVNDGIGAGHGGTDNTQEGAKKLKSNVWQYAEKLKNGMAKCLKCKTRIKTTNGATSTLRKHLIKEHRLTHLTLLPASRPKPTSNNSVTREKKNRLDYLATVAIIEDGRTFGDLRKSGITKFLDEAIS